MSKQKKFSAGIAVFLAIICLIVGVCGGFIGYLSVNKFSSDVYVSGDMQVHFLELGNKYTGDCTYIKAGETDILIDAGSRTSSIPVISEYINKFVSDGVLEYVIVTHAHQDHYAGFATNENEQSLFDLYDCKTVIDFALTNQNIKEGDGTNMYENYLRERDAEVAAGATHYTARECIEQGKSEFTLSEGIVMNILDQKFYYEEAESENDYSVCTLITYGEDSFLFTGDLEEDGEESLIERNNLPAVTVYKAGHHGSKTSSSAALMAVVKPEVVCVCCCAGSSEYTDTNENQFPTQKFIDNVAPYTDKIYVTTLCTDYDNDKFEPMNGNITVYCGLGGITLGFTGSEALLKDTEWFKNNRTTPDAWK